MHLNSLTAWYKARRVAAGQAARNGLRTATAKVVSTEPSVVSASMRWSN